MKTKLSIIAGLAVSAALMYFAFRNVDFAKLRVIYGSVNNIYLLPVGLLMLAELFCRGLRWKLLLAPAARHPVQENEPQVETALAVSPTVRVWDSFRLEVAGLALNNILPLRLGELMRGTMGAGLFRIPVMTVFATILVERALDAIVLAALFVSAAALGGLAGGLGDYGAYLWPTMVLLAGALTALAAAERLMAHPLLSGFFGRNPRARKLAGNLALGARAFHSPGTGGAVVGLACLQWLIDAVNLWLVSFAFGIGPAMSILKGMVLLFTTALAASIPGMPGYFGNFEFAVAKTLAAWGVPGDVGFAYATYVHVATYLVVTILGLVFIYQMGQSVGKVWAQFRGRKE